MQTESGWNYSLNPEALLADPGGFERLDRAAPKSHVKPNKNGSHIGWMERNALGPQVLQS